MRRIHLATLRGQVVDAIDGSFDDQLNLLKTTGAMFSLRPNLTREEFHRYYQQLKSGTVNRGFHGLGWVAVLAPSEVPAEEARLKAEGAPSYRMWQLQPHGGEVMMVEYLEPWDGVGNLATAGLDIGSEPVRHQAFADARKMAEPRVSGLLRLVQEPPDSNQKGFLVCVPVYRNGDPGTPSERESRCLGYVYSPVRAETLFQSLLSSVSKKDLAIDVYDGSGGIAKLIYRNDPTFGPVFDPSPVNKTIGGRTFTLKMAPSIGFSDASDEALLAGIWIAGVVIGMLLSVLSFAQRRRTALLEQTAAVLAERERSLELLARAGRAFASSLDVQETLNTVAGLAVPEFADWCVVYILRENGVIERLASAHRDPETVKLGDSIREAIAPKIDAPSGIGKVMRTGHSELYADITPALLQEGFVTERQKQLVGALGFRSVCIVPMNARGRTLGAMSFAWSESKKVYTDNDRRLFEELGERAGIAADNAILFKSLQSEVEERRRTEDELRSAEEQVRKLNEDLEKLVSERTVELEAANSELEAFCYSVSHDLRAPLRSVDGFSKALLDDFGNQISEEGHTYVHRVRAASKRMDELITALLTLSRLTRAELNRQPSDLSAIASEAVADAVRGYEDSRPEVTIEPNLIADCDPRMIRSVFENLLGNAIKFSSRTERPKISVGKTDEGAFFVKDNGVGFNPRYSNKLFSPFERLHSPTEFPGSGIGLATVQRIVARHGGSVWAESEPGLGATFFFTLG
jgi:signal transduction histidine kinase/CHASE1-domain containing sensor protein